MESKNNQFALASQVAQLVKVLSQYAKVVRRGVGRKPATQARALDHDSNPQPSDTQDDALTSQDNK